MKKQYWIGVVVMVGLLGACSSAQHRRSTSPAVFSACVHPDQSKQFSYRKGRPMQIDQKVMLQRMENELPARGRSRPVNVDRYDKEPGEGPLYDELAEYMESRQFCTEGYFELDSRFEHGYEHIIGECNDSATTQQMKVLPQCGPKDRL